MTEKKPLLNRFNQKDFEGMQTRFRANFFNSIVGFKSPVLVGSKSKDGQENLAIFSSLMHMGSSPALFGILFRPSAEVPRHTLQNIEQTQYYTINTITTDFVEKAHQTSAKYPSEVSEFEICGIEQEYVPDFTAPFVKQSPIRLGLKWVESIPITHNNTLLVIGKVVVALVPDALLEEDGMITTENGGSVVVSGLESYHTTKQIARFKYARP